MHRLLQGHSVQVPFWLRRWAASQLHADQWLVGRLVRDGQCRRRFESVESCSFRHLSNKRPIFGNMFLVFVVSQALIRVNPK